MTATSNESGVLTLPRTWIWTGDLVSACRPSSDPNSCAIERGRRVRRDREVEHSSLARVSEACPLKLRSVRSAPPIRIVSNGANHQLGNLETLGVLTAARPPKCSGLMCPACKQPDSNHHHDALPGMWRSMVSELARQQTALISSRVC
jgi:hypothetical protein